MAKLIKKLKAVESGPAGNLKANTLCKKNIVLNRDVSGFLGSPPSNALIKESGGYILLENGFKLLLE